MTPWPSWKTCPVRRADGCALASEAVLEWRGVGAEGTSFLAFPSSSVFLLSSPHSTRTRRTSQVSSLWRRRARCGPIYSLHTRLETDPGSEEATPWKGEAKTQMDTKPRKREEDRVKPQGRKEARGSDQWTPAGPCEPEGLLMLGWGRCALGQQGRTLWPPLCYQRPLCGVGAERLPSAPEASCLPGQWALWPLFTLGLSGIPEIHRSPKLPRDLSHCSFLHICHAPPCLG